MKNKKSQVTIFIIIGIVILVIVALVYSTTRSTEKATARTEMRKVAETRVETQPVKIFVEDCLDSITQEGLELIGKQGGRLWGDQGGTLPDFDNIDNVSYAIKRGGDYEMGLFGDSTLPVLKDVDNSIQHQLEMYILNYIKDPARCNLTTFESRGFTIRPGTPTVDVKIAKDNVDVRLDYPLEVESSATGAKTTVSDFSKSQKVRLGHIYDFAAELVNSDTINLTFDIEDQPSLQGIVTRIKRNAAGNDDIINLTDPRSFLKGPSYSFRFARENRMPMVAGFDPNVPPDAFNVGDKIYPENLTDTPAADDPDEDNIPIDLIHYNIKYPLHAILPEQISPSPGGTVIQQCPAVVEVCATDQAEEYCRNVTVPTGEIYRIECS